MADILRNMVSTVDNNVIYRMMRRYASAVNNALLTTDHELLKSIYEETAELPYSQTARELSADGTGYILDGVLLNGNESLNICFKEGLPYVLKVCNANEYDRAVVWLEACKKIEPSRHIIKIEAVCIPRGPRTKYFVFMPLYAITLESLPKMSTTVLLRFYAQMSGALEFIHEAGFAHMDFKPANILIAGDGDFVLADLGSIARMGHRSESTRAYLPREMWEATRSSPIASPKVDWWMMAVTLCEKVCGYGAGHGANSAKESNIMAMLHDLGDKEDERVKTIVNALLARL